MKDQDLIAVLARVAAQLMTAAERRLQEEIGLPLVHYQALRAVAHAPECRVFEVAAELSMTFGGASKIIDRLASVGLVGRRDHPRDRRSSLLELTPAGQDLLSAADRIIADEVGRTTGVLSPSRRTALGQGLDALDAVLSAAGRVPSNHHLVG